MKAKELIEALQQVDPETEVVIPNDDDSYKLVSEIGTKDMVPEDEDDDPQEMVIIT